MRSLHETSGAHRKKSCRDCLALGLTDQTLKDRAYCGS